MTTIYRSVSELATAIQVRLKEQLSLAEDRVYIGTVGFRSSRPLSQTPYVTIEIGERGKLSFETMRSDCCHHSAPQFDITVITEDRTYDRNRTLDDDLGYKGLLDEVAEVASALLFYHLGLEYVERSLVVNETGTERLTFFTELGETETPYISRGLTIMYQIRDNDA